MKRMLCPYKVKITHITETLTKAGVDHPEFCECDYDKCYFFTTHIEFNKDGSYFVPECRRAQHDCEV